jgi:hypothetical protein
MMMMNWNEEKRICVRLLKTRESRTTAGYIAKKKRERERTKEKI